MIDFKMIDNDVYGWFSADESRLLYDLGLSAPNSRGLELGSFCGKSSIALASALKTRNGILICIDKFWDNSAITIQDKIIPIKSTYDEFIKNIKKYDVEDAIIYLRCDIRSILQCIKGCFGIVFIDANHELQNVILDAIWAYKNITTNGYIVFHDYNNAIYREVKEAIEMLQMNFKGTWQYFNSIAVFKKS